MAIRRAFGIFLLNLVLRKKEKFLLTDTTLSISIATIAQAIKYSQADKYGRK